MSPKTSRRQKCLKETLWGLIKAECVLTRETGLKTGRRWKCLKETLWGLVKAECVSTRETDPKSTQRWWCFNERNPSEDYSKLKDFIERNLFKDHPKVRSLLVVLDHWDTNQGLKELKNCPIVGFLGSMIC